MVQTKALSRWNSRIDAAIYPNQIKSNEFLFLLFFQEKSLQRYNFFMIPTIYSKEKSRHSL